MEIVELKEIISKEKISDLQKDIFNEMLDKFVDGLPNNLYYDPYKLEAIYGFNSNLWKKLFKIPSINRQIEMEIAELVEFGSRSAIRKLAEGDINGQEVAGIRELLNRSRIMQENNQSKTIIVYSYIPEGEA
jgi:hypothetical protein